MEKRSTEVLAAVAVLSAPIVLYIGAYSALLRPCEIAISSGGAHWTTRIPSYRMGGVFSPRVFGPANWADQQIRPRFWFEEVKVVPAEKADHAIAFESSEIE